jgi:deoxyribose-phosphate aldolase
MAKKYEIITQKDFTMKEMAALIDYSLLVPYASQQEVEKFLKDAKAYEFKVVFVNNSYIAMAAQALAGSDITVASVAAFPFGALTPENKAAEVESAIKLGAGVIDIVTNIGALKSADWDLVFRDMASCAAVAHKCGIEIKVILECCYLTRDEIIKGCQIAQKAGLDYVKTSTGFGTSAAVLGDVKLMKSTIGEEMGVKAAGPIGDYETAVAMLHAGAQRLGSRRGIDILRGCPDWHD